MGKSSEGMCVDVFWLNMSSTSTLAEEPGRARRSQEEPGGARKSQEEAGERAAVLAMVAKARTSRGGSD